MAYNNKEQEKTQKKIVLQVVFLVIYLILLIFAYLILIKFNTNPFVALILLTFVFLITIGVFLRKRKRSLYSRLFPDRKRKPSLNKSRYRKETVEEKKPEQPQPRIFKPINLEVNYHKHIVLKCEKCGNIIPNFVKKCPFCNKIINY